MAVKAAVDRLPSLAAVAALGGEKRGRGRPPKAHAVGSVVVVAKPPSTPGEVKRGRGRPPKNPAAAASAGGTKAAAAAAPAKKGGK